MESIKKANDKFKEEYKDYTDASMGVAKKVDDQTKSLLPKL